MTERTIEAATVGVQAYVVRQVDHEVIEIPSEMCDVGVNRASKRLRSSGWSPGDWRLGAPTGQLGAPTGRLGA
jgi:hypothetical protein